jgi:hypothetical protein
MDYVYRMIKMWTGRILRMAGVSLITSVLFLSMTIHASDETIDRISLYVGGTGSLPVGMLGKYTNAGFGGMAGCGFRPITRAQEIEFQVRIEYDLFNNSEQGKGAYSFTRYGTNIKLTTNQDRTSQVYFLLGGGIAQVRIKADNGYPPYHGQSNTSSNFYASAGIGIETHNNHKVEFFTEAQGVDILNSLFGDYRFIKAIIGLRF